MGEYTKITNLSYFLKIYSFENSLPYGTQSTIRGKILEWGKLVNLANCGLFANILLANISLVSSLVRLTLFRVGHMRL